MTKEQQAVLDLLYNTYYSRRHLKMPSFKKGKPDEDELIDGGVPFSITVTGKDRRPAWRRMYENPHLAADIEGYSGRNGEGPLNAWWNVHDRDLWAATHTPDGKPIEGLDIVSPEFDILTLGSGLRANHLTRLLWKERALAREIDKVTSKGLNGATKDMPVFNAKDMYNPDHFRSVVKYNPRQIGTAAENTAALNDAGVLLALQQRLLLPAKRLTPVGRQFGFADPHVDINTPADAPETASPLLANTLHPQDKLSLKDTQSNLITRYINLNTINKMYDAHKPASAIAEKYGVSLPYPFITKVGDDFVEGLNLYGYNDMLYRVGMTEDALRLNAGLSSRQADALTKLNENIRKYFHPTSLEIPIGEGFYDIFDYRNKLAETMSPEEYDLVLKIEQGMLQRLMFNEYISGLRGMGVITPRYAQALRNADDPQLYITDNTVKRTLRGHISRYYKDIKDAKREDFIRRRKELKSLLKQDNRAEIADDARETLNDAILSFGRSVNASEHDANVLSLIMNSTAGFINDTWKEYVAYENSPNRPGWMLKSLMEGNPLERLLSKDGMISVNNILNHIKKGSDIEKAVVDKVLNTKFGNQSKINYADFKHAVLNELVSYKHTNESRWQDYGFDRLYSGPSGDMLQRIMMDNLGWSNEDLGFKKPDVDFDTYTFSSPRLPVGNARHYNNDTLGHSRTFTRKDDPKTMYVMESQSDWAQNYTPSTMNQDRYNNLLSNISYIEGELAKLSPRERSLDASKPEGMTASIRKMRENIQGVKSELDRQPHEKHLTSNFESRQIQENLLHASRKGLTKMRYPTSDTAAKIEGYSKYEDASQEYLDAVAEYQKLVESHEGPIDGYPEDLKKKIAEVKHKIAYIKALGRDVDYSKLHRTILKKYANFPKLYKKLYRDSEVRTVTDPAGNTWYEVDVPKNIRRKELLYGIGGGIVAGSTVLKPRKSKNK